MAHIARLADYVKGVILMSSMQEGLAIELSESGTVNGFASDLPIARLATSGQTVVFAVMAAPDDFPRPVDLRQYRAGWYTTLARSDGSYSDPLETITRYNIGLSNLYDPTLPSGVIALANRRVTIIVGSSAFNDTAAIRVPGAWLKVADDGSGKWTVTTDKTVRVAFVEQWNSDTSELTISL